SSQVTLFNDLGFDPGTGRRKNHDNEYGYCMFQVILTLCAKK
ncbi:MAG: hypothetical protein ACI82Q_003095, partial [Nonlabens sp.]